jgi:poly(3-hydroxybutyrate) depolymerase
MAYRLANEISGKIAAVGCVSGQSFQDVISPSAKVPIIHFHALDDNSVNFDGGTIDEYDYKPVLEVIDTWKDFNECTEDSIIIRDEDGIKGYLWTSDGDSSNIILYTSNTGGHSWIMNKRLGITNLMWEFFNTGNTTVPVSYDSIDHDGLYRSFKTHLPNQYYTEVSDTVTYPIILAFHGWDQDADIMETNTGMSDKADKEGFIVSYLNYVGPPPDTSWNYFMFENKPDDIGFTERVLDTLISQYPVDTSKVYVIGFSDGCGMADRLPFALPGRIKGAGTVSGMIAFDDSVETHKVPLIHVNYNHDAAYTNVQERIPYWVELNGCNAEADTTVNAQDVIGRRWENPDGINHVVVISAPGSSHAWVNTDDVKATDLIWEFFETGNAIPDVDTLQVSISDKKGENKLFIYPNPANNVVNIVSGGNLTGTATVELLDVNGRIVYKETYTGKESMEIKLPSNIVKGLYFVKLMDENKVYSGKLLIH